MTSEKLKQKIEQDHEEEMRNLKKQLDTEIRIDATQLPGAGVVPAPFRLTFVDIEKQRACEIDRAQQAIRQGWDRILETRQRLHPLGVDLCDEHFLAQHQELIDRVEAIKARALRYIAEKYALLAAFYNARLDIYNALRIGDVREAKEIASLFLARLAVAP